jgi:hypothetical protein
MNRHLVDLIQVGGSDSQLDRHLTAGGVAKQHGVLDSTFAHPFGECIAEAGHVQLGAGRVRAAETR